MIEDYDLKALFAAACLAGIQMDSQSEDGIRYKVAIALTTADYAAEIFLQRQQDLFDDD